MPDRAGWRPSPGPRPLSGRAERVPDAPVGGDIDLGQRLPGASIGLHPPERHAGIAPYRWTDSLALLRVAARVGGPHRARARVAVDGRRVEASISQDAIEFELPGGGERSVVMAFEPLRPAPPDRRRLGVAVQALRLGPA